MDTVAAEIEQVKTSGLREKGVAFAELTKPRIAFLLMLTSAAGYFLGSKGNFDYVLFANSMVAIMLLAFGVATLNQYWEHEIDKLMERTANRPIPTLRITPTEALVFGLAQCLVAELYLFLVVNVMTAILGLIVIVGYVLVYTPLKTR